MYRLLIYYEDGTVYFGAAVLTLLEITGWLDLFYRQELSDNPDPDDVYVSIIPGKKFVVRRK